ncbi:unnamed protein product, partial [Ectocarpus fasciculatus]
CCSAAASAPTTNPPSPAAPDGGADDTMAAGGPGKVDGFTAAAASRSRCPSACWSGEGWAPPASPSLLSPSTIPSAPNGTSGLVACFLYRGTCVFLRTASRARGNATAVDLNLVVCCTWSV